MTPALREQSFEKAAKSLTAARLSEAYSDILCARSHASEVWVGVADDVAIASLSDDPELRFASAYFRLWHTEYMVEDAEQRERQFRSLVSDVDSLTEQGIELDPNNAILLHSQFADSWQLRGEFDLARCHELRAHALAKRFNRRQLEFSILASLGFLTCMSGFVSDGILLALRSTAKTLDLNAERFIGAEGDMRQERQQGIELADCYEFTRNWSQAASTLRTVNTLIGPGEVTTRSINLWALARCYSKLGEHSLAAEIIDDTAPPAAQSGTHVEFKHARTVAVFEAAIGNTDSALETCYQLIEKVYDPVRVAYHKEIADEAARIARDADEPHECIAILEPLTHHRGDSIPLLGTLAYRDLAWAYGRTGRNSEARTCLQLAREGQRRFTQRGKIPRGALDESPATLISARELHRRARRSHHNEQESLRRGIGSVVHDVRTPLQSVEFALALGDRCPPLAITSIVQSIDRTLEELLRDIETSRSVPCSEIVLADVVDEVVATFETAARQKQITLESRVRPNLRCESNAPMLNRVVSNLVSNAVKYSPAGGLVQVTASALGKFIDLHIVDSGPGVPAEELQYLFQWGGCGTTTPTAGEPQNGIGLYTANRLATLLGATIRTHVRTSTARSAFTVRLRRSPPISPTTR